MKSSPKAVLSILFLLTLVGCATGAPPSAFENALWRVTPTLETNIIPVAVIERVGTNTVVVGTNYAALIKTNYHFGGREEVGTAIQAGGAIATGLGQPWVVPLLGLLGGLYAWWAERRNSNKSKLNNTLGQNLETSFNVVGAQPGGASLVAKLKEEIISQQVDANVKKAAAEVHDEKVNTVDAKESAERVMKPNIPASPVIPLP